MTSRPSAEDIARIIEPQRWVAIAPPDTPQGVGPTDWEVTFQRIVTDAREPSLETARAVLALFPEPAHQSPTVEDITQMIQSIIGGSLDARQGSLAEQAARAVMTLISAQRSVADVAALAAEPCVGLRDRRTHPPPQGASRLRLGCAEYCPRHPQ